MKNKINGLALSLLMLISVFAIPMVLGYDASNPYTVTIKWIVPQDTTFTVALAGAETEIIFNATNKSSLEVNARSQTDSVPIITISNQGNIPANYTAQVTAFLPSWVTLKGKKTYDYGTADTITNTTGTLIDTNVASGNNATYWLWSDFSNGVYGTNQSTFQISAIAS